MEYLKQNLEHRLLLPTLISREIDERLSLAKQCQWSAICLPPFWVKKAARELKGSPVQLGTVVGYPYGYQMTETKSQEIAQALENGADELEIALNISAFRSGMPWVKIELAKLAHQIHHHHKLMSVLIDRSLIAEDQLKSLIVICRDAGTDFINFTGVTNPKMTAALRQLVPMGVGIKIIHDPETPEQAKYLLQAGADRLCFTNLQIIKMERDK